MKEILTGKVPLFSTPDKALKKILQERERGDLAKARKTAVEAIEKWPDDYNLSMEAAQACLDLSDYPQAANFFKNAHKRHAGRRGEILDIARAAFMQSFSTLLGSFIIETYLKSRNTEAIGELLHASPESFAGDLMKRGETRSKNLAADGQDHTPLFGENELLLGILYRERGEFEKAAASLGRAIEILPGDAQAIGAVLVQIEEELPHSALVKFYLGLASSLVAHPEKAQMRFFQCLEMEDPPVDKILAAIESASGFRGNGDLLRGEILVRSGAVPEGVSLLRASLWKAAEGEQEPGAAATTRSERMELAETRLAALLERVFAEPEVLFLYSDIAAALGRTADAVAALERAAAANPAIAPAIVEWLEKHGEIAATPPAQNLLAAAYLERGDFEKGAAAARRAVEMHPAFTGAIVERLRAKSKSAAAAADPTIDSLLCELCARAGDREGAEEAFGALRRRRLLTDEELARLSAEIMRHCGVFLTGVIAILDLNLRNKKVEEAIPYVLALYREKPDYHGEFAPSIGEIAEEHEEHWGAIAGLVDFMARDEQLSQPFRVLQARAHLFAGEIERAVFEFDQLLMLEPDLRRTLGGLYTKALERFDANAMLHLALYHLHLDEGSLTDAAHHLCRTFELDPGQIRDVIARFEKLVERDPGNLSIWKEMLATSLAMKRTSLAREILTRAIAALPGEGAAALHVYGAKISAAEGKWDDAMRCIALALTSPEADLREIESEIRSIQRRDPSNPLSHLLLGDSLVGLGRENEALSSYRRSLELSNVFRKPVKEKLEKLLPLSMEPWLVSGLLGEILWIEGSHDEALRSFAAAQKGPRESLAPLNDSLARLRASSPDDAHLALLHAGTLSLESRYGESVSLLEELIARDANLAREATDILLSIVAARAEQYDANRLLARISARAGDIEGSRRAVIRMMSDETADPARIDEAAAELVPNHERNGEFLLSYAGCAARAGRMAVALERYRAAFDGDPSRAGAVLKALEKWIWPPELLDAHRFLAVDCRITEHRSSDAFSLLAACTGRDAGTVEAVMERLSKLIDIAPRREYFSFGASLLALSGRIEAAESLIAEGCAALGGDDAPELTIELAELLDSAGDTERSTRLFAAALESAPAAAPVLKRIERAYARRTGEEIRTIAARFEEGRADGGETIHLVEMLLETGAADRALDILARSALSGAARSTLLGRIYLSMDRPTLACAALAAAERADFASEVERHAHRYLEGIARERAGDYGRAAAAFGAVAGEHGDFRDSRARAELDYTLFLESNIEERPLALEKMDAI